MNMPMESYRMKVSEMQRRLANKAMKEPEHRFTNLFDLLTWEPLMEWAFEKLMTNRGSRTAGIDGLDKKTAIKNNEKILHDLEAALILEPALLVRQEVALLVRPRCQGLPPRSA